MHLRGSGIAESYSIFALCSPRGAFRARCSKPSATASSRLPVQSPAYGRERGLLGIWRCGLLSSAKTEVEGETRDTPQEPRGVRLRRFPLPIRLPWYPLGQSSTAASRPLCAVPAELSNHNF